MDQFYKELQALLGKYNVELYASQQDGPMFSEDVLVVRSHKDGFTSWDRFEFISGTSIKKPLSGE